MLTTVSFPKENVTEASLYVSKADGKWRKIDDLKISENQVELYLPLSRLQEYNFALKLSCTTDGFANYTYLCIPDAVSEKEDIMSTENILSLILSALEDSNTDDKETICNLDINTKECCLSSITNTDAKEIRFYIHSRYPFPNSWVLAKTYTPNENGVFTLNLPTKTNYTNFKFDMVLKNNTTISYGNTKPENFPQNYKDILEYLK